MNSAQSKKDFASILLYVLGFLLMWEWIRPLEQLTSTNQSEVFLVFLLIAFAGLFFQWPGPIQAFIKTIYILYAIYRFYFDGGFFSKKWIADFYTDLKSNIALVLDANYQDLSNIFRTVLFFMLLWLMVYLIHYWMLNRKRIFIFLFMTIIYITVLDTFTLYKGEVAIVRTVVAGFTVLGILTYLRLLAREKVASSSGFARNWIIPLVCMIVFSAGIGIAAPKAAPIWPDPVPFLKTFNEKGGEGEGISKIGYGTNDSRLGGPFIADNTVVFRAQAKSRNYWRVETKDVYTGKGWVVSEKPKNLFSFVKDEKVPLPSFPDKVKKKEQTAIVTVYKKYPHVFYPQGLKEISMDEGTDFQLNPETEKISTVTRSNRPTMLADYSVKYDVPAFKVEDLKAAQESNLFGMDKGLYQRYTQVPEGMPQRITELAAEITAGKTSWYEKATAIEQYFDRPDFAYDQKNVAVPGTEDDYVDQFLFETKRGYCDNYSTSMAVMLRSIGIPARWVKGYTDGDLKSFGDESRDIELYEITNNNAHSWVEVFLPNLGWISFEPTKGFANSLQIDYETTVDNKQIPVAPTKPRNQEQQDRLDRLEEKDPVQQKSSRTQNTWTKAKNFFSNEWKWIAAALIALGAAGIYIYQMRGKWIPYYLVYRYRYLKKDENFGRAYLLLLRQFNRYGLHRKNDQTLRSYAGYIDSFFYTREMSRLTTRYEQYLYHQEIPEGIWVDSKELWENLIKKTIT